MLVRIWDSCPSRKTPETASRNWASARPETRCCANCWWEARTISWGRLGRTPIYDDSGCELCERGGKNAKKRAAVAVARKLAVLLHRLWASGEVYEPLGHVPSRGNSSRRCIARTMTRTQSVLIAAKQICFSEVD